MAVSYTTTCRDIDELAPAAQKAIRLFFYLCHKEGIPIFVTETYRPQGRQDYLYEQGRTRPGNIVTWTRSSRHTSRLAWDIGAAQLNGNKDIYNLAIIKKAGAIAKKVGITWGGTWVNNIDYPHFEVPSNWKIPKGYSLDGIVVSIPTKSTGAIKIVSSVDKLPQVPTNVEDKEEEKDMAKQVLLKDVGNPTLRTSAITFIKKAMAAGKLNSDEWLKAAEAGTLPVDVLSLLHIHCTLDGPFLGQSDSATLKNGFTAFVEKAFEDGAITNKDWVDKAKNGSISAIDADLLRATVEERRAAKTAKK